MGGFVPTQAGQSNLPPGFPQPTMRRTPFQESLLTGVGRSNFHGPPPPGLLRALATLQPPSPQQAALPWAPVSVSPASGPYGGAIGTFPGAPTPSSAAIGPQTPPALRGWIPRPRTPQTAAPPTGGGVPIGVLQQLLMGGIS